MRPTYQPEHSAAATTEDDVDAFLAIIASDSGRNPHLTIRQS